jgi:hypothetical protein
LSPPATRRFFHKENAAAISDKNILNRVHKNCNSSNNNMRSAFRPYIQRLSSFHTLGSSSARSTEISEGEVANRLIDDIEYSRGFCLVDSLREIWHRFSKHPQQRDQEREEHKDQKRETTKTALMI